MSLRMSALTFLAALSLSAATFAAEPEKTSQPNNEHASPPTSEPAAAAETKGASEAAGDTEATEEGSAKATEAAEMSPEEAAAAAVNGEIEYAKERIDPHKATAAEIAAHNATAAPDDRIVCRREQLTGTHRGVKVCMTVGQRRALMEQTQEGLATSGRNAAGDMRGE
jgi:cytoskeletal protein RodZ